MRRCIILNKRLATFDNGVDRFEEKLAAFETFVEAFDTGVESFDKELASLGNTDELPLFEASLLVDFLEGIVNRQGTQFFTLNIANCDKLLFTFPHFNTLNRQVS